MKNKLTEEEIKYYNENGYLLVKDFIDHNHIDEFMDFVAHVISIEAKIDQTEYSNEEILNRVLIDLKRKNPSSSSWIYQTLLASYKLKKFFVNIDISKIVMELLNMTDERNLGTVSPAFRYDIPGDKKNVRTWHQDGNYFLENKKGEDHLVVWIPMNKATKDNGSVIVAEGSHKQGKLEATHEISEGFKSEQYTAPEEQYKKFPHIYIEAKKGDIAFINMDLLHSSGVNRPAQLFPEYPVYERNKK